MIELLAGTPLLLTATFLAGALNAVAGGGTFLTLPALIFIGLPPVMANATSTVALLPGYISSTYAFRKDLRMPGSLPLASIIAVSVLGGALGAALLVLIPGDSFRILIPWLLLLSTAAFAFGPTLVGKAGPRHAASSRVTLLTVLIATIYGGYFNGGLGIILLALFGLLGVPEMKTSNALKNLVSTLLTIVAVIVYAWGGAVSWPEAVTMMAASMIGGYVGARFIRQVRDSYVRTAVIIIGLIMTVLFFIY